MFVLQHPRERHHPLGTARFIELGLERAHLEVAHGLVPRSVNHPMAVPDGTALLFPRADAPFLEDLPEAERPASLLVLDGTWSQARALYRQNTWLHDLPHRQVRPLRPSRYRVRREPRPEYVSTLEALAYALSVIEPEVDLDPLLLAFERLMDEHLASRGVSELPRTRRPRVRPPRAVPEVVVAAPERLAVVYLEPSLSAAQDGPRHPVQLCALRLGDGVHFQRFTRTEGGVPTASHLAHMGLSATAFEGASEVTEGAGELLRFLEGCTPVSWNLTPCDLLNAAGVPLPSEGWVSLKASYCNLRKRHAGSLESVLRAEGLRPVCLGLGRAARADAHGGGDAPWVTAVPMADSVGFAGRAAQRMGNALALVQWLRREARTA